MRVATMDRYLTATETIVAIADAEATGIAGRPGYGVNSPAVCVLQWLPPYQLEVRPPKSLSGDGQSHFAMIRLRRQCRCLRR
jgi:hypothetical protein